MFNTTTCALIASKLAACEKHVPVWFEHNTFWRVVCLVVIFVTGIIVGLESGLGWRYAFARLLLLLIIYASAVLVAYTAGHADGRAYSQ